MTSDTSHTVSTNALKRYLFAISQYCRSVSDLTEEDKRPPTAFHSSEEPPISLGDYIIGIGRRLQLCRFTVLLAAVYVGRVAQRTERSPSILSIHRLYASTLLFASRVLRDNVPSDELFGHNAGFPAAEVTELQLLLESIIGKDASDYISDVEVTRRHLDATRHSTLRSQIAAIIAEAFGVRPPPLRTSPSRNASPGLLSIISPFTSMADTPLHSADPWAGQRSDDSPYIFGSGAAAARGLRHESCDSDVSFALPPADDGALLSLPCFAVQMPHNLKDYAEAQATLARDEPTATAPHRPRPVFMTGPS